MSKKWILHLILFVIVASALVYAIVTKNDIGIIYMTFWSVFYFFKFIFDLVELRIGHKRYIEQIEKWTEMFNYKGE